MDIVDVLRSVGGWPDEVARQHFSCGEIADEIDRLRAEVADLTQQLAAANGRVEMLAGWLRKYGNHYRGPGEMCELLKHSDYPCTCGLDAALSNLNEDSAG
jgi:hypothetical protein